MQADDQVDVDVVTAGIIPASDIHSASASIAGSEPTPTTNASTITASPDPSIFAGGHSSTTAGAAPTDNANWINKIEADVTLTEGASGSSSSPTVVPKHNADGNASSSEDPSVVHDTSQDELSSASLSFSSNASDAGPGSHARFVEPSSYVVGLLTSPKLSDPPSPLPEIDQGLLIELGLDQAANGGGVINPPSPLAKPSTRNLRKRAGDGDENGQVKRKRNKPNQDHKALNDLVAPKRREMTANRKSYPGTRSTSKLRKASSRRSSGQSDTVLPPTPDSSKLFQSSPTILSDEAPTPPEASTEKEMQIVDDLDISCSQNLPTTPDGTSDEPLSVPQHPDPALANQRPDGEITDAELLSLAAQFRAISEVAADNKKQPRGRPPLWAHGRQALCETLPSNHAVEGAYYQSEGRIWGAMFDAGSFERDYSGSAVVITGVGGGKQKNEEGLMVRKKDQYENLPSRALRENKRSQNPIIISVGKDNPSIHFGFKELPKNAMYAVLCWFVVTDVWHEKDSEGNIIIRCRFERLTPDMYCWFDPVQSPEPKKIGEFADPYEKECSRCRKTCQQIACEGWMCLNGICPLFWTFSNGQSPDRNQILYDPRFLQKKTKIANRTPPYPLRHELYDFSNLELARDGYSLDAKRGRYCRKCGCCGVLLDWSYWRCSNVDCDFEETIPRPIIPARMIENSAPGVTDKGTYTTLTRPTGNGPSLSRDVIEPLAQNMLQCQTIEREDGYKIVITKFPALEKTALKFIGSPTSISTRRRNMVRMICG